MVISLGAAGFSCAVVSCGTAVVAEAVSGKVSVTGLKLIKPELVDFPIYTTKEELTTVTLFYDAYYDFGVVGVFLFSAALGLFAAWLMDRACPFQASENPDLTKAYCVHSDQQLLSGAFC